MLTVFIMNVNNKYFAINGNTSDVGGKIFETNNRNTTNDNNILIPKVTLKNIKNR